MEKLSYALGMIIGHNLKGMNIEGLNTQEFSAGVAAVLAGEKTTLTDIEAQTLVQKYMQEKEAEALSEIDTENVERMVHVMHIFTVVREDVVVKKFTRDELQAGAPETMDGYWQVPRLVE